MKVVLLVIVAIAMLAALGEASGGRPQRKVWIKTFSGRWRKTHPAQIAQDNQLHGFRFAATEEDRARTPDGATVVTLDDLPKNTVVVREGEEMPKGHDCARLIIRVNRDLTIYAVING